MDLSSTYRSIVKKYFPNAMIVAKRIEERLGIPSWTAHDLRLTFATQLSEALNVEPVIIEKCLGHKMPRIMATYNKNEMLPQRKEALERWAQFVYELLQEKVIPLVIKKFT